ncbi:MAG: 30S ribosomal protein S8 [Verrucomicrobia bacterium]|nr:30S ribosomal protein S8 [Verrucomicrobiota bacterium]
MTSHDPIADLLTRIRNASRAQHRYTDVQWSNLNQNIIQVLIDEKFVDHFLVKEEDGKTTMRIFLRYTENREPLIRNLRKISNPGRRKYVGYNQIPDVFSGMGISVVSTSKGVLAGSEARKRKLGGELLCYVW